MIVAGVVIETTPGAEPRVAARLLRAAGVSLQGGDGLHRIAAVLEADDGVALQAMTERLLHSDQEILGIFPTFVGDDGG